MSLELTRSVLGTDAGVRPYKYLSRPWKAE